MPKMDDAIAKRGIAALAKRIQDNAAAPGTEATLRRYMEGLRHDQPVYDEMTQDVANMVRQQWPTAKATFAKRGQLKSIAFKRVGPQGVDFYAVDFDNGSVEYAIGLDQQGKIDRLNFRALPAP